MASALKTIVSKKKRRFTEDGFNLDLSYIGDRIIAMGFPAENVESLYRNSLDEVKRFLDHKHKDHYFIYNLCSERVYDIKKFHDRVATYPFDDHHPPDFSTIKPFCEHVDEWLRTHQDNVAVVHCKAGKGRTGTMICCYLLHSGKFKTADEVLTFYGKQRTHDQKGVTIPSQRRYINYYADMIRQKLEYKPVKLYLRSVVLDPVPNFNNLSKEFYLQFEVKQAKRSLNYESTDYLLKRGDRNMLLNVDPPILICEDIKIEFSIKPKLDKVGIKPKFLASYKEFHFWFNTFFVENTFISGLCHSLLAGSSNNGHAPVDQGSEEEQPGDCDNGGPDSGPLSHHLTKLRWAPPPERHVSCTGGAPSPHLIASGSDEDVTLTNLMKHTSVSDDHLLTNQGGGGGGGGGGCHVSSKGNGGAGHASSASSSTSSSTSTSLAALSSFKENRIRHSSVPQTARSPGTLSHLTNANSLGLSSPHGANSALLKSSATTTSADSLGEDVPAVGLSSPIKIDGTPVSLRLTKPQIDKAFKDKSCKVYQDDFKVTLFLVRPYDQSDLVLSGATCPFSLVCTRQRTRREEEFPLTTWLARKATSKQASKQTQRPFPQDTDWPSRSSLLRALLCLAMTSLQCLGLTHSQLNRPPIHPRVLPNRTAVIQGLCCQATS
eukprot:TCALIF_06154-PA protein Name:"Similar to Pten Phosphatidylinositol 3,4,5-trisphosphate 3-phosphatase and dual-specificity protein phosphatase PTEN (Mus musculus)" AED:0.26 eAED:0.29 QI:0/0/0/0.5/1/1/2/0/660